jgi:hypothetical protein
MNKQYQISHTCGNITVTGEQLHLQDGSPEQNAYRTTESFPSPSCVLTMYKCDEDQSQSTQVQNVCEIQASVMHCSTWQQYRQLHQQKNGRILDLTYHN